MLDQTRLPGEVVHVEYTSWPEVVDAIKAMVVRGAPAIGVAGAMGVALAAHGAAATSATRQSFDAEMGRAIAELRDARPTAVNLAWAVDRMAGIVADHEGTPDEIAAELADAARTIHADEVERCHAMGRHAVPLFIRGASILTHCNAGALATAGLGTATAAFYVAHEQGRRFRVYADETRPLLQGARLTAWELQQAGVPVTVITDNMAATVMAQGRIQGIIVGTDRLCANGDFANKIGTLGVAVLAKEFGVPFYVAAPSSSIDFALSDGSRIPIEERGADEVSNGFGRRTAPVGVDVYNPAFDVTPHRYLTAIVTERGVVRPPFDVGLRALLQGQ